MFFLEAWRAIFISSRAALLNLGSCQWRHYARQFGRPNTWLKLQKYLTETTNLIM
jgi:hypothetical protein